MQKKGGYEIYNIKIQLNNINTEKTYCNNMFED